MTAGPLYLRIIDGAIEERGGQVLATLNENVTPSMKHNFAMFLENLAVFGPTDEIIAVLYPEPEKTGEETTVPAAITEMQAAADADQSNYYGYEELRDAINAKTRMMFVPTPFVLQLLRNHFSIPATDTDTKFNDAARNEISYREAHEEGTINMDYDRYGEE